MPFPRKSSSRPFRDRVRTIARGGRGGHGCVSFLRQRFRPDGGPNGGDGGRGGNVVLQAWHETNSLTDIVPHIIAQNGSPGTSGRKTGRKGSNEVVRVPLGTQVIDMDNNEPLCELLEHNDTYTVALGGKGGKGNVHFATGGNRAPRQRTLGKEGQKRRLQLFLKTIADVGLVGFPNAGKSTFLTAVSRARPKMAPYPFTTLQPHVGSVVFDDWYSFHVADIPGLIAGAHTNVGLGHEFLRHIERTKILLYVVDMASPVSGQPEDLRHGQAIPAWTVLQHLEDELETYQKGLAGRAVAVVANKMDMPGASEHLSQLKERWPKLPIFPVSASRRTNLSPLLLHVRRYIEEHIEDPPYDP
eukprot:gb/GECH01002943.1/.p1 GENE.gb/GECH01002943.1/~~gb/GECH01002943.1/.p1  ORF type:complete len:358 (+),score=36.53 gb/GECH01002943.1/:1-1074(+)